MFSVKRSLVALISVLALIGLVALVTPHSTQGQGNPHTLDVNVTNPIDSPVPVREVGGPVSIPVQISVNVLMTGGDTSADEDVYTVPLGKRLVIEHVSLNSENLDPGNAVSARVFTQMLGQNPSAHPLDVRVQVPVDGPLFVANHPLLAYADSGLTVKVIVRVDQPQGSVSSSFSALNGTMSGHLEDLP